MSDSLVGEMEDQFGREETADYIRLAKAVRSLVHTWEKFVAAPVGSVEERAASRAIEHMTDNMKTHPEHTAALVEALCAIILHLRAGAPYEDWFESLGISPVPGVD